MTATGEKDIYWVCGGGGSTNRIKADKHGESQREVWESCGHRFLLVDGFIHYNYVIH